MDRSTHERFSLKLKGGIFLLAIVFGILMLSGGPPTQIADADYSAKTIAVDPTNHAWDAY